VRHGGGVSKETRRERVRDGVDGLSRDEVGRQGEERARADVGREEHAERRGL